MIKSYLLSILLVLMPCLVAQEQIKEYNNPEIVSFETMPESVSTNDIATTLSISDMHFKHLKHSLKWKWNSPHSQWKISQPINYQMPKGKNDTYVSTFVFWVYADEALNNKTLKIEFLKNREVQCYFYYHLNFTGWRGAWVAFDRDMQGKPVEGMDEIRFTAPDTPNGTLFFDHIIASSMQDVRYHTPDFQAPYINKKTDNHWLILLKSWNNEFNIPINITPSASEKQSIENVSNRLREMILKKRTPKSLDKLEQSVMAYQLTQNSNGTIKGVPVFFERYGETYEYMGAPRYSKLYKNPMGLTSALQTLLDLAIIYNKTTISKEKKQAEKLFIQLTRHLLDQGFQAGSSMGTLHHLGYSMRQFYPTMFLMQQPLQQHGLKKNVQQAMEWFSGVGEVKAWDKNREMDIDTYNTNLMGRLIAILMLDDTAQQVRYMYAFSAWLDNGYQYAPGTRGSFKPDGTIYHHRHNYPAYAVGGLNGAIQAVYLLKKTNFSISQVSHQILKNALLAMRFYCNLRTWPLSLSGRHPDGKGELKPEHYGLLALAGSPDGKEEIDTELAQAYLRLVVKQTPTAKMLKKTGYVAEKSPEGNRSFPYSCLNVHRRKNWSISAMGHSRYLWATETYRGENMYGRYLNHGSLQILCSGNPISNFGSGYRQEGWDWNHFPGTTATVLPMKELRTKIRNIDQFSGFEEMLLSDEAFAGGISLANTQGAFAMKLHEHDKYNGSLRARKSVFFFDNRVVALGSNIQSELDAPTHTTLFQVYLQNTNIPFYLNGKKTSKFPQNETIKKTVSIISDGLNNYFFIKNGELIFKKSTQFSIDEETEEPTENPFALAAINHGGNIKASEYEYMILVQPDVKELEKYISEKAPYTLFQKNYTAHIVKDNATHVTGYVFFEQGKPHNEHLLVKDVDTPCLIMTNEQVTNQVSLSVADPDLRFYKGSADEKYDTNGKRIERSVYGRKWINNESGVKKIEITLQGKWKLKEQYPYVQIKKSNTLETVFEVTCQHGKSNNFIIVE